jgi:long-subunit fatty acid transport protein
MTNHKSIFAAWVCLAALFFCSGLANAITTDEVNAGIQLNFSTPGARSLGMGGAFLGLADDATAAFTNPAGLTVLSKQEISVEGRSWDYTSRFTDSGNATFPMNQIDSSGLVLGESSTSLDGLSFLSYTYPKKRWAIAFYRHELANFEAAFATNGPTFDGVTPGDSFFVFPLTTQMNLRVVNLGLSAGYRVSDDLSIGMGLSRYDFEISSLTLRSNMQPPDFDNPINLQTQHGDDNDLAFNLGLLWKLNPKWNLGLVYRQGPDFEFSAMNAVGSTGNVFVDEVAEFNVPDVYGLGFAYKPIEALTITFDYDRIEYSALANNVTAIFPSADVSPNDFDIDNASEYHLGLEYVFANVKYPIALRCGSFYDPDHKMRFVGAASSDDARVNAVLFLPGDDEIHYSVGLGFVFGDSFQLDLAGDFSDLVDTLSLSGVIRF